MIKRLLFSMLIAGTAQAMVFDNKYLPLYLKPFTRRDDAFSHIRVQPFFMHADRAFSDVNRIDFPNTAGTYDQRELARAMTDAGFPNPLRPDFQLESAIPWRRRGRLDAQGLAFLWEQAITPCVAVGINMMFAHVAVRHQFVLTGSQEQLPIGDQEYLFQVKDQMHEDLGICPALFSKTGFGDIDLYLRLSQRWDYTLKFRRIDASLKLGTYIPSAQERDIFNPASISLGGNKHWGVYADIESDIELKEDLSVGLMFRAIKRIENTRCLRMPLLAEAPQYGVLTGPVRVDPGWTFVFNPYVTIAHLRRGLGVRALYTMVAHLSDILYDRRPVEQQRMLPSNLVALEGSSSWGAEYVSIGAYYDFGKIYECPTLYPKLSLYWDIPVNWLVAKRAAETNSVSLMLEFDF